MTCGIYLLEFDGYSGVYIGQSKDIEVRYKQHLKSFKGGTSSDKLLKAYAEYGNPTIHILTTCSIEELDDLEKEAILLYDSVECGLNTRSCAGGGNTSMYGELNGRSKYTNEQIVSALKLIVSNEKLKYYEIELRTGVPKTTLVDISTGNAHTWLQKEYPDLYVKLLSIKGKRNTRFYPKLISPDKIIYSVEHLSKFCLEHGLDTGNLSKLLNGKARSYRGWKVVKDKI